MRRRQAIFAVIAALSILLAGCDSFAILYQFAYIGSPLTLTLEKVSVRQGESIALYPRGGTPPYSFGLLAGSLYYAGTLGSVSDDTYTAGNAIGTVTIHLSDAGGNAVDAVLTIIPPTPGGFAVAFNPGAPTNDILVSWTYVDTSLISGFEIQRSLDGVTFTDLAIAPSAATSYVDGSLSPSSTYYYRMYALAGTYHSLPTTVQGAKPS